MSAFYFMKVIQDENIQTEDERTDGDNSNTSPKQLEDTFT